MQKSRRMFLHFIKCTMEQFQWYAWARDLRGNVFINELWKFIIMFQKLGFSSCPFSIFIKIQICIESIIFQKKWTSIYNRFFYNGTWLFRDQLKYNLQNRVLFLIFHYCFGSLSSIRRWKKVINFRCVFSLKNNRLKNEVFNDCFVTDGNVSWTFTVVNIHFQSHYISQR